MAYLSASPCLDKWSLTLKYNKRWPLLGHLSVVVFEGGVEKLCLREKIVELEATYWIIRRWFQLERYRVSYSKWTEGSIQWEDTNISKDEFQMNMGILKKFKLEVLRIHSFRNPDWNNTSILQESSVQSCYSVSSVPPPQVVNCWCGRSVTVPDE